MEKIRVEEPKSFNILNSPVLIEAKVGAVTIQKKIHLRDLFSTEEELVNQLADLNEIQRGKLWKKLKKWRIYGRDTKL